MTAATPAKLREAITEMDSMAQDAFSEIATIAKLALASLETPEGYSNIEGIARVLNFICGKALDAENYINCTAEGVGCNYKDQAMLRRWDAKRKAREIALPVGGFEP
jgi:hypothetical protein